MPNYELDTNYAIGKTLASMGTLRQLNIPVPDQVVGQTYSQYYVRADWRRVGAGVQLASWVWDIISVIDIAKIMTIIGGTAGVQAGSYADSAFLYVRTDLRDGSFAIPGAAGNFNTYRAAVWAPQLFGPEGNPVVRSPYAHQSVKLTMALLDWVNYL